MPPSKENPHQHLYHISLSLTARLVSVITQAPLLVLRATFQDTFLLPPGLKSLISKGPSNSAVPLMSDRSKRLTGITSHWPVTAKEEIPIQGRRKEEKKRKKTIETQRGEEIFWQGSSEHRRNTEIAKKRPNFAIRRALRARPSPS